VSWRETLIMRVFVLLLAMVVLLAPVHSVHAIDDPLGLSDKEARLLYKGLKEINSFGLIAVALVGDTDKIGLSQRELTDYARTRFQAHFKRTKLDDVSRDSKAFLNLVSTRDKKVGTITFRVWVVGNESPIIYHLKIDAGNFDNPAIYTEEILGHGTPKNTSDSVRTTIDEMMKDLASVYYKVKSQNF
jgi:hypothetical protein